MLRRLVIVGALAMALSSGFSSPARASNGDKTLGLGADGGVMVPFGGLSDSTGIGLGALVHLEYFMNPTWTVTGRVGFIYHLAKSVGGTDIQLNEIPILGGVKYALAGPLYLAGEIGAFKFGGSNVKSQTKLGITAGAGFTMSAVDVRAGLHILNLGEAGDSMGLMVTAGYNFW
jgi:hypothetical protein